MYVRVCASMISRHVFMHLCDVHIHKCGVIMDVWCGAFISSLPCTRVRVFVPFCVWVCDGDASLGMAVLPLMERTPRIGGWTRCGTLRRWVCSNLWSPLRRSPVRVGCWHSAGVVSCCDCLFLIGVVITVRCSCISLSTLEDDRNCRCSAALSEVVYGLCPCRLAERALPIRQRGYFLVCWLKWVRRGRP